MIPFEKQYLVIDNSSDTPVGVLDEAFVAEYGNPGVKFIMRGSAWKIRNIYQDKIYVKPVDDPSGAIPSWVGEQIPVPFEVAMEVGEIRSFVENNLGVGKDKNWITEALTNKYPAQKGTILNAIRETVEQFERGYPLPSERRITIEEWKDYLILQCCFGSLVNKTLARIIGHILTEKFGCTIGVQEDPYRIVLQTKGIVTSEDIIKIVKELSRKNIRKLAVDATIKTGLFKRRIIHVARKFGAISKWADFSSISLKQLLKNFEGTCIFDEAVKNSLSSDIDVEHTLEVLRRIRNGAIELSTVKIKGVTPLARIGIERISHKTDLIPPEKMKSILIESAKARLFNEAGVFLCTKCWKHVKSMQIKELPKKQQCPNCGSSFLGMLKQPEEVALKICEKSDRTSKGIEKRTYAFALESARLMSEFGYVAALALSGHNLQPDDVKKVLSEEKEPSDRFFELVIDAERRALKKRFV
ncbi:MAG: hypothetical protein ABIH76_03505 [Candidatus Bathyarchaeota archaeon]